MINLIYIFNKGQVDFYEDICKKINFINIVYFTWMRINQVKRIHNKPMKSPSPDFVSRNGIKDTSLDMRDLKKYLEKKDQAMRSSEFQQSSSAIIGSPEVEYLRKQLQ